MSGSRTSWILWLWMGMACPAAPQEEALLGRVGSGLWVFPCGSSLRFERRLSLHDLQVRVEETGKVTVLWRDRIAAAMTPLEARKGARIEPVDMEEGAKGVHVIGQDGFREEIVLARTGWLYVSVGQAQKEGGVELRIPFLGTEAVLGPSETPVQEGQSWTFRYEEGRWWRIMMDEGSDAGRVQEEPWGWRMSAEDEDVVSFACQWDAFLVSGPPAEISPSSQPIDLLAAEEFAREKTSPAGRRWRLRFESPLTVEAELKGSDPFRVSLWKRGPGDADWVRLDRWRGEPLRSSTPIQWEGGAWIELEARSSRPDQGDPQEALQYLRLYSKPSEDPPVSAP